MLALSPIDDLITPTTIAKFQLKAWKQTPQTWDQVPHDVNLKLTNR